MTVTLDDHQRRLVDIAVGQAPELDAKQTTAFHRLLELLPAPTAASKPSIPAPARRAA